MEREKRELNMGELEGPVLAFGGVYSNLQALEAMRGIADALGIAPGNVMCTGDIVGYCAQPEECLDLVRDWGIHSIVGNVEIQLREGQEDCGCDFVEGGRCESFSATWYPYATERVRQNQLTWLESLPDFIRFRYAGRDCVVLHGGHDEVSRYVFASTPWPEKQEQFALAGAEVILAGHCGLPFAQEREGQAWLNPGVIGMPANDGTTRVWYMLLDDAGGTLSWQHKSFDYDHTRTARLMMEQRLPLAYARTLGNGLWDNCEILPEHETMFQGIPLQL